MVLYISVTVPADKCGFALYEYLLQNLNALSNPNNFRIRKLPMRGNAVAGKKKALLPFPPLRTGREIFTSSGSSLYEGTFSAPGFTTKFLVLPSQY
jgi:hypothetical protein